MPFDLDLLDKKRRNRSKIYNTLGVAKGKLGTLS